MCILLLRNIIITMIKCVKKVKEARCYCCLSLENFYTDNRFERFFYFVNASMYLLLSRYALTTYTWYNNNKDGHEWDCLFYTHWILTVRYCAWYFFVNLTSDKSLNVLQYIGYYKFFKVISHANTVQKIIQVGNTKVKEHIANNVCK